MLSAPAKLPVRDPLASPGFQVALPLNPYELSPTQLEGRVADAAGAGVGVIVAGAMWGWMCPSPDTCRWDGLDRLAESVHRHGLRLSVQVATVPDWLHPEVQGPEAERLWTLPQTDHEREQFARFAASVAHRYARDIVRVEVWNEPNHPDFAKPDPDADAYASLLVRTYDRVKAAEPGVLVTSAGLSRIDLGFLRDVLAAARERAGGRRFLDEVGIHPYSGADSPLLLDEDKQRHFGHLDIDENFAAVGRVSELLDDESLTGVGIWLGEYGFSTTRTWMPAVSDSVRALYLSLAFDLARRTPRVTGLCWYSYVPSSSTGPQWSIATADGRQSATFRALAAVSRGIGARPVQAGWVGGSGLAAADVGLDESAVTRWFVLRSGRFAGEGAGAVATGVTTGDVVAFFARDSLAGYSQPLPRGGAG